MGNRLKPVLEADSTILDKIKHLSPTKRRRIERLLEIYGEGGFRYCTFVARLV